MSRRERSLPGAMLSQELALSAYLDVMLKDSAPRPVAVAPAKVAVLPVTLPVAPPDPAPARSDVTETPTAPVPTRSEAPAAAPAAPRVPAWAGEPFQCLLFRVGSLLLAAPLVELNGIVEWDGSLTRVPGCPPWQPGVTRHRDHTLRVVDTARLLGGDEEVGEEPVDHLLLIGEFRFALQCGQVREVVTLSPASVNWRAEGAQRPWIAGTDGEHMCSVLDPGELAAFLERPPPRPAPPAAGTNRAHRTLPRSVAPVRAPGPNRGPQT